MCPLILQFIFVLLNITLIVLQQLVKVMALLQDERRQLLYQFGWLEVVSGKLSLQIVKSNINPRKKMSFIN